MSNRVNLRLCGIGVLSLIFVACSNDGTVFKTQKKPETFTTYSYEEGETFSLIEPTLVWWDNSETTYQERAVTLSTQSGCVENAKDKIVCPFSKAPVEFSQYWECRSENEAQSDCVMRTAEDYANQRTATLVELFDEMGETLQRRDEISAKVQSTDEAVLSLTQKSESESDKIKALYQVEGSTASEQTLTYTNGILIPNVEFADLGSLAWVSSTSLRGGGIWKFVFENEKNRLEMEAVRLDLSAKRVLFGGEAVLKDKATQKVLKKGRFYWRSDLLMP